MAATTIRAVAFSEILEAPNRTELLEEYAAECALPELAPINPQRETYAAMERIGMLQCFGVYHAESLAGFASVLVYVVPHYGKGIATVESLFLRARDRNGRTGNQLMNAIEEHARKHGCVAVLYSAPADGQFERLMRMLKPYRHSNTVFLRAL